MVSFIGKHIEELELKSLLKELARLRDEESKLLVEVWRIINKI